MASSKSNSRLAIRDMAKSLADVFKDYSRQARSKAFNKLIKSDRGRKELDKLIINPKKPLNQFFKLAFRDWLESKETKS